MERGRVSLRERRKALLAYFMYGVPYILWDNIARAMQLSCPHIEKSGFLRGRPRGPPTGVVG
jgi:hypothetical protein